ncbi:MAG TPA: hypothetical protein VJB57_07150 [Dehalococcoidia bacterium]|nr:hypothetical protein [Dehalococcoidia bacterium]
MTNNNHALEAKAAEVITALSGGLRQVDVANQFGVSREAVSQFVKRHRDEVSLARTAVVERLQDLDLTQKEARIRERAWLYGLIKDEAESYGITTVETTTERDGDTETVIVTRDFRGSMVKEARGLLMDIATELGQLPRPDVHIGDKNVFILEVNTPHDPGDFPKLG